MREDMRISAENIIICERMLRAGISYKSEISFIIILKEARLRHRPNASLKVASFTCLVAGAPICTPIEEPTKIKIADIKSTFPLNVWVKDAYAQLISIPRVHVPAAIGGLQPMT